MSKEATKVSCSIAITSCVSRTEEKQTQKPPVYLTFLKFLLCDACPNALAVKTVNRLESFVEGEPSLPQVMWLVLGKMSGKRSLQARVQAYAITVPYFYTMERN